MAVLSPYSISAIPPTLQFLMTDVDSEIIDFYPMEFAVDTKGKRFAWMGEVILPFIDQSRLLHVINAHSHTLTPHDHSRNQLGRQYLYLNSTHPINQQIQMDHTQPTTLSYSQSQLAGSLANKHSL